MIDDSFLARYRMMNIQNDGLSDGYKVNRLYGLHDLVKENIKSTDIVCEVGSYGGISSSLFASYCGTLYCIDPFYEHTEEYFDNTMKDFTNYVKVKEYSMLASYGFADEFFDFVYLDADHSYHSVIGDISVWLKKVKKSGIIGGHDYAYQTVKDAVAKFFGKPDQVYEDSSWIVRL